MTDLVVFFICIAIYMLGYLNGGIEAYSDMGEVLGELISDLNNAQDIPHDKDYFTTYCEQEFNNKIEN